MADIYEYRLIFEHEKQPLDLVVHNIPNASSDDIYSIVIELGNFLKGDDGLPGPQGPGAPVATTEVPGSVKPDGTTVTVDPDGTIHAAAPLPLSIVDGKLCITYNN